MIANSSYALTIDELSGEIARLIKANDLSDSHQDNRVSTVPDMRTIRYYSTLGLLDRPLIVGRVAKYNRRHILQILAIKTLQKAAMPLSEIQAQLYGLSEDELEALIDAAIMLQKQAAENHNNGHAKTAGESAGKSEHTTASTLSLSTPVYWREIVIQPGLKIMADQSWTQNEDPQLLIQRIQQALEALQNAAPGSNGEDR